MRLKDRVALVTGAGGGIGAATAVRFAREGASVVLTDVNEEGIAAVAKQITDQGGWARAIPANVVQSTEVQTLVDSVVKQYGRLDILVNNAGITRDALTRKMTEEQWDLVLDVNLKGTFLCSQAVFGPMSERKYGKIISTSSVGSLGNPGQANYAASKAGVIALTKTLALEYARYNINVNCIAPGATRTAMTEAMPDQAREALLGMIPFHRMAEPEEIANLHLFLASDESAYITGQVIFIDGGLTVGI